jgi:hypothetical protein
VKSVLDLFPKVFASDGVAAVRRSPYLTQQLGVQIGCKQSPATSEQ